MASNDLLKQLNGWFWKWYGEDWAREHEAHLQAYLSVMREIEAARSRDGVSGDVGSKGESRGVEQALLPEATGVGIVPY